MNRIIQTLQKVPVMLLLSFLLIAGCSSPVQPTQTSVSPASSPIGSPSPTVTPAKSSAISAAPDPGNTAAMAAESAKAANMKLRKIEGDVNIKDNDEKDIPAKENIRLYSGYDVGTEKKSYAWIDLDSAKLAKLDAQSDSTIKQDGKKLEIEIKEGGLFFDIAKPLENDESLFIRTSTLAIGIRGTVGWVSVENENRATVSLL